MRTITKRTGVTLLEVVASLFLCGLLFSVVIAGFTQHRKQIEKAQLILTSTAQLDLLVADWYQSGRSLPVGESGVLSTEEQLMWRLTPIETEAPLQAQNLQKCRLASWHKDQEVCGIELLVQMEMSGQ